MTPTPSAGDIWEWEDGSLALLVEELPYSIKSCRRFSSVDLTNWVLNDYIVFSYPTHTTPGNIHRWRYVA